MKTAIITYNDVSNYGALLQAYALQDYICTLGHECKQIAYRPFKTDKIITFNSLSSIIRGCYSLMHIPAIKKRIKMFCDFRKDYLNMTDDCFTLDEQKRLNDEFECFITGSDQVFNCQMGINKSFYLDFVDSNRIKASYAASFGTDSIPQKYEEEVGKILSGFNNISVREESGKKIISEISKRDSCVVCDPVFLKSGKEWGELCGERIEKNKYIFVYPTQKNKKLDALVERIHKETGLKVITTRPSLKYKNKIDMGPLEFLNYIKFAECVVTSSFHATAFSLIFKKPLFVISHSDRSTRTSNLLEKAGLLECIVKNTEQKLNFDPDYISAWKKLEEYIGESKKYIDTIYSK